MDDFCEGIIAWQWTFFVPHNINGLANLMGGTAHLSAKLDSLFTVKPDSQGKNAAPSAEISGMIGQYAHGNEPSHHIVYMYDETGEPWKAQKLIHEVMPTLYQNAPEGYSGNEDIGQMAAWYLWNAMGMYPVTHGDGRYYIGAPLFPKMSYKHGNGAPTILADKPTNKHIFVESVKLNGKEYKNFWFDHIDIFNKSATIEFKMSDNPSLVCFKQMGE